MATEDGPNREDKRPLGERIKPTSARVALVAVFFAFVAGGLAAWATTTLNLSSWAFLIVGVLVGAYLWKKPLATEGIGSGLYVSAMLLILTPILFYVPNVFGTTSDSVKGAGMLIGSILGLVIWGFVFLLIAIVVAALGYFFKRRAAQKQSG